MHVRKTVSFAIGDQKKIIIVQKYFIDRCVMCAVLIFASLHKNIEICKKKLGRVDRIEQKINNCNGMLLGGL